MNFRCTFFLVLVFLLRKGTLPKYFQQYTLTIHIVVPPASIGILVDVIEEIAEQFDTAIPIYEHAGDGNLHPHLLKDLVEKGGGGKPQESKEGDI